MKLQLWKCIKVAMHSALSSTTVKRQSLCSKIIIASTVRCLITMNRGWLNFFDPALAPLLCRLMEMNDRDFIFPQCTIVSLDMARLLCSSGLWAGFEADPLIPNGKQLFYACCLEVKRVFVVWMRAHSVLIPLCLISLSETLFPLSAGSNWSQLTRSQSQAICKENNFLSLWFQLELSINLTEVGSCAKWTKSGMLLRMNCFIRLRCTLNSNSHRQTDGNLHDTLS